MTDKDAFTTMVKWLWVNLVSFALLIWISEALLSKGAVYVLVLDIVMLIGILRSPYVSASIICNVVAVVLFQLSVVLVGDAEPFANGQLLLLSFTVFLISLFLPKKNLKQRNTN